MKPVLVTILLAVFAIIIFIFYAIKKEEVYNTTTVKLGDTVVTTEVADTAYKRSKGLMFRKEMGENNGMLFIFQYEDKHTFWMANTYIPLDIIWLDSEMKIVHIEKNLPGCMKPKKMQRFCETYTPNKIAKYVIETNAGFVDKHNITLDTPVEIKLPVI